MKTDERVNKGPATQSFYLNLRFHSNIQSKAWGRGHTNVSIASGGGGVFSRGVKFPPPPPGEGFF